MTTDSGSYHRLPLVLLLILAAVCIATVIDPPAGRVSWLLEVGPGLVGVMVLVIVYKRFPMSRMVYLFVFIHVLVLIYGGYYTYAKTPLGNWAKEAFGFSRNHYDRVGHIALGVFPAFIIREVLLRKTPLQRGGWLYFLVVSVVLAVAAFWELLEWWVALPAASDVGEAFFGSQGDIWDAQWDIFLALAGAMVALPLLSRADERSMAKLPGAHPGTLISTDTPQPSAEPDSNGRCCGYDGTGEFEWKEEVAWRDRRLDFYRLHWTNLTGSDIEFIKEESRTKFGHNRKEFRMLPDGSKEVVLVSNVSTRNYAEKPRKEGNILGPHETQTDENLFYGIAEDVTYNVAFWEVTFRYQNNDYIFTYHLVGTR